jgi:hydroxymethylglutaryl-CoA reductase (NADPH)
LPTIPPFLLKQLYVKGSLRSVGDGVEFRLNNHLASATITGLRLWFDGVEVSEEAITIVQGDEARPLTDVGPESPFHFSAGAEAVVRVSGLSLETGAHAVTVVPATREIGEVTVSVDDTLS